MLDVFDWDPCVVPHLHLGPNSDFKNGNRTLWLDRDTGPPSRSSTPIMACRMWPRKRYEMIVLHIVLVLERLRGAGERRAWRLAERLVEAFVGDLDGSIREMAVGDTKVPSQRQEGGRLDCWTVMCSIGRPLNAGTDAGRTGPGRRCRVGHQIPMR